MSLQNLFADAKELKELIDVKRSMIDIINQDISAFERRKQEETEVLNNALKRLEDVKKQLNSKIDCEDWGDIVVTRTKMNILAKKTLDGSILSMALLSRKIINFFGTFIKRLRST